MIQIGFGTADITPAVGSAIPGGFAPRTSTGVRDLLQARACVIEGHPHCAAVVGVDAVSLRFDTIEKARGAIESTVGIPAHHVTIAANHTHSGGPSNDVLGTDSDDAYCDLVATRIAEAVRAAHERREEAEAAWASTSCEGWSFNRRFKMKDGSEATNPGKTNPNKVEVAGPTDPEIGAIAFRRATGGWLGAIASFACHSTVVGGTEFSADYSGCWQQALHGRAGSDFTLVFLNGACGDVTQIDHENADVKESGPEWAKAMAGALADSMLASIDSAQFHADVPVRAAHGTASVRYRHPKMEALAQARALVDSPDDWAKEKWQARDLILLAEAIGDADGVECSVDALAIGDAAVAASPWQPFCEYGLRIKQESCFSPTLIATFANGMLGYVPTPRAMEKGGYEPTLCRGSKLQPDAGDRITRETIRVLSMLSLR